MFLSFDVLNEVIICTSMLKNTVGGYNIEYLSFFCGYTIWHFQEHSVLHDMIEFIDKTLSQFSFSLSFLSKGWPEQLCESRWNKSIVSQTCSGKITSFVSDTECVLLW